jgi:magnesium-transporting ATPase (P-type)
MSNGTEIHNEICNRFRNTDYSQEFIIKYTDEGCSEINRIILEDIISNNNILIGYCDVVIDYEDFNGRNQKALIEVKSSAEVINKDPQEVLRQIKKYRFYNKKFTKTFLIYTSEESYDYVNNKDLFIEEDILVVDIDCFVDSEKARWLEIQKQRRVEEKKIEKEEKKQREAERKIEKEEKEKEQQKMLAIQLKKQREDEEWQKIKSIFEIIMGLIVLVVISYGGFKFFKAFFGTNKISIILTIVVIIGLIAWGNYEEFKKRQGF